MPHPPNPTDSASQQSAHDEASLAREESKFGDTFRRDYPIAWWGTLVGPFLATGAMLGFLWISRGGDFVLKLAGTALGTFFGLGRFVILLGSDQKSIQDAESIADEATRSQFKFMTSLELLTMVTWMDLVAAVLLVFHAGFLFKIPKIGPGMLKLREEGQFFLSVQPWMRRFTFLGLVLFVAFPVAATGSVAGSIFARLLGMSRTQAMLALICGTILGNGGMYLIGTTLIRKIPFFNPNNPWNLVIGVGVILGLIALLNWRYQKAKRRWKTGAVAGAVAHANGGKSAA